MLKNSVLEEILGFFPKTEFFWKNLLGQILTLETL